MKIKQTDANDGDEEETTNEMTNEDHQMAGVTMEN